MSAINDLLDAVNALHAEDALVIQALTSLTNKISELQAIIAGQTNLDPQIQEATDAIKAEVANLQAAITTPIA